MDVFISLYTQSRAQAEKLIKQNRVKIKIPGKGLEPVKPSCKIRAGQRYVADFSTTDKEESFLPLKPCTHPVPVVFKDAHILVVNKPAGLVVHPAPGHKQDTLVNALMEKFTLSAGPDPLRPGVVHRLDKDVSGLMVLSKTEQARASLVEGFKTKKIKRIYRALTVGKMPQAPAGTLKGFIGRHPRDRKKFYCFQKDTPGAKPALTRYQVLESFQDKIHHIECQLETGRTHQIRVHTSTADLPVLGDELYFSRRAQKRALTNLNLKKEAGEFKIALYSAFLRFIHPVTGKTLSFALPWPEEFHGLLNQLRFQKEFSLRT